MNNQEVIPKNDYQTWYYEYPLQEANNKVSVGMAFIPQRQVSKKDLDLDNGVTTLNVDPPAIIRYRFDPLTKDFIITIRDPAGVLSYNIYYANTLTSSPGVSPFILAQPDYPVSGAGTTDWRDNGTFTGLHPADPRVQMRFYKLEVFRVNIPPAPKGIGFPTANNTIVYENSTVIISGEITYPDPSILEYQFSIEGKVVQPWSKAARYTWATPAVWEGPTFSLKSVKIEVRDNTGRIIRTKEILVCLARWVPFPQ